MPNYDTSRYDPPAPVAEVLLRNRDDASQTTAVIVLLDTGADVTLLPRSVADELGLQAATGINYELVGFDGRRTNANAVQLELLFLNKIFRGYFLLIDDDWGILGRDVLDRIVLLLDGPRHQWQQQRP
jgi:aspartyl protease